MNDDEKRGYSKGYAAGQKRKARAVLAEHEWKRKQAFRARAFLAALPFAMSAEGWTKGDEAIRTLTQRVALAWNVADESMERFL